MSFPPLWLRYVAGACAAFIAAGVTWPLPGIPAVFIVLGLVSTGGAVVHGLKGRRDPYDLNALREFDEKEEVRNLDVPDVEDVDQVQCLCCMNVYAARFPICPHCKASKGSRGCCG